MTTSPIIDLVGVGLNAIDTLGWPLARQLDFVYAAAALNCRVIGARGGIQSVEAIENLISTGERYESLFLTAQE